MSEEHESFIKTPKQLIIAVVLAFVLPVVLIAMLSKLVGNTPRIGAGADTMTEQAVAERIAPVAGFQLADASGASKVYTGEQVYNAQCAACHTAGVAGAPKFGDIGQWKARIATGYDALLSAALKGKGAMAAQGGGKFSDTEIGKAVVYMTNKAGGSLAEPAEGGTAPADEAAPADKSGAPAAPKTTDLAPTAPATPVAAASAVAASAAAMAASASQTAGIKPAAPGAAITASKADRAAPAIVNRAKQAGTSVAEEASKTAEKATEKMAAVSDGTATAVSKAAAAAAAAAAATSATVAAQPAIPTTADPLTFADAADVQPAFGDGIPKRLSVFFDSGKSEITTEAMDALWNLIYFTKSGAWSRIGLSGFTDGTGNAQANEQLSRKRMTNVREVLVDMGMAEDRIVMVRPEQVQAAAGASESARRVDVYHVK